MSPLFAKAPFSLERLKELILCIAERTAVGVTKLEKLLYLCDFESARVLDAPISGDMYRNFQWGPVPKHFVPALAELVKEGRIQKNEIRTGDKKFVELKPQTKCKLEMFSKDEQKIIEDIITEHGNKKAYDLVLLTHGELTWKLTNRNEEIPYFLCHYRNHTRPSKEAVKALLAKRDYVESIEKQLQLQTA